MMEWRWKHFDSLSTLELYDIMNARQEVFIVEQAIAALDADYRDVKAFHLCGYLDGKLVAYLRVLAPGTKYKEAAIGRVLTTAAGRGRGLGKELMTIALEKCALQFPGEGLRMSAQSYLKDFYRAFGFEIEGDEYIEEEILHVQMTKLNL